MSKVEIAKPVQDSEVEGFVDEDGREVEFKEDDCSASETKKAVAGFTPTQKVSWPGDASPPREPESGAAQAHHITRGQHAKVNKVLDAREEAEKARVEDHRFDPGTGIESKYATGFSHQAGKHKVHTGPLTRGSGRLKIFPGISREEQEWLEEHTWQLRKIAKDILHGRSATVFERRFLDPLDGHPKPSVGELAAQFNVTEKRIYNIEEDCKRRVIEECRRRSAPKSHVGDKCPMCGRVYAEWDFSQCRYADGKHDKYIAPTWTVRWSRIKWPSRLNPDCLPYQYWLELVEMQRKFFGIF